MARHFGGVHPSRYQEKLRLLVVLGILIAIIVGFVIVLLLTSAQSTATQSAPIVAPPLQEPQIEMLEVLIPVQRIEAGTAFEPVMFRRESRPKVGLSMSVVREFDQIRGGYARSLIIPDQPLHEEYVTRSKPTNMITANIPEGYRAVTIRVDAKSGVEGWALPGARVDVVWASEIRNQQAITVIVENAKVLSAERNSNPNAEMKADGPIPSTVTLLVTADEAKKIQLASISGSLSLSLRGDRDTGKGSNSGSITVDDLLSNGDRKAVQNPCQGRIRTCENGVCEELCLRPDGSLAPLSPDL